jgi:hypothetical protein
LTILAFLEVHHLDDFVPEIYSPDHHLSSVTKSITSSAFTKRHHVESHAGGEECDEGVFGGTSESAQW